jgi:PAS domain-containing protein
LCSLLCKHQTIQGQILYRPADHARCPELKQYLEESRSPEPKTVRFDCNSTQNTVVTVTIKPVLSESGAGQVGTLIYMENVTSRVTLQSTIEELETTAEELQSTNEELQSLNEELEITNEELSSRTRELDEMNMRYSEMMERMPWPVLLVNDDTLIYMFNSAAQKLFGFAHPSEKGMRLQELPLDNKARHAMLRRHRSVMQTNKQSNIRNFRLTTNRFDGIADIHFTPLSAETGRGVIVNVPGCPAKERRPKGKSPAEDCATEISRRFRQI